MTTTLRLEVPVEVSGDADLKKLNDSLDDTETRTSKMGSVSTGVFQGIGQAAFSAGLGIAQAGVSMAIEKVGESLELASTKAEAASKVNNLFGESADVVMEASEGAATAVGLSSGAYLVAAGDLGNLTTNLGYTGSEAANMSVDMIQLAADMGSFNDASTEEVTAAMGAAFRGETEPIRRFGVMLDDATVKAKAVELGLYSGVGAIDAHAKAEATWQLITEKTVAAQGDLAETADGLAGQQKINAAIMEESWTRVGEALTPLVQRVLPIVAAIMQDLAGTVAELAEEFAVWVEENEDVVAALSDLAMWLGQIAGDYLGWFAEQVLKVVSIVGELVAAVGEWVDDNQPLITQLGDIAELVGGVLSGAFSNFMAVLEDLGYRIGGLIGLALDLAGGIVGLGDAVVKALSGDFAGAAAAAQAALDGVGSFGDNVLRVLGDAGVKARDEASATAAATAEAASASANDTINALAGGYAAGRPEVDAAATAVAATVPEAMAEASTAAVAVAVQTPGQIASGLRSTRDAVGSAMEQLREDMKAAIAPAKEIAQLEGQLSGKALTRGLASTDPIVRAQADATVAAIETRLDELKGVGETAGEEGAGAIPGGMASEDRAVTAAAASTTRIVSTQFDLMENGARVAAQTANLTLSTGLQAGTAGAANAASNVADVWGSRMVSTIRGYRDDIAAAATYATAPIRGFSPPRVGPLRHIDEWGVNVAEGFTEPFVATLSRDISRGLDIAPPSAPGGLGGGASSAGGPAYYITVQAGVGDPVAIGRETVAAIQAYERSSGRDWRAS